MSDAIRELGREVWGLWRVFDTIAYERAYAARSIVRRRGLPVDELQALMYDHYHRTIRGWFHSKVPRTLDEIRQALFELWWLCYFYVRIYAQSVVRYLDQVKEDVEAWELFCYNYRQFLEQLDEVLRRAGMEELRIQPLWIEAVVEGAEH